MKLEETIKLTLGIIGVFLILYISFWFANYKFRDCKKVGHTDLYCLMDLK